MNDDLSMSTKSKNRGSFQFLWRVSTTTLIMVAWATITLRSVPSSFAFSTTRLSNFAQSSAFAARGKSMSRLGMVASVRTASSSSFSEETRKRIEGLDASKEFSKLAIKLNKSPDELRVKLSQMVSGDTVPTEKEEYMEWLLSGVASNTEISKKKKPVKSTSLSSKSAKKNSQPSPSLLSTTTTTTETQTFQTDIRFDDESQIDMHWNSRKAVAEMGLTYLTEIQAKTFSAASTGNDVLGRARTGTGKTIAFLLPAIERLIRDGTIDDPHTVGMLIVSPTRELATQIGDQAKQLLKYHRGTSVQVVFGGTNVKTDVNRLSSRKGLPTVLVATPGRLLDHLQTTKVSTNPDNPLSFGKHVMSKTNLVVLDETDRLLDMGFRREIDKILNYLPSSRTRQTLLFSATIPADLKTIMKQNMKPGYAEVDCVQDGDAATHTNESVTQTHVVLPSKETAMINSVVETIQYAVQTHINRDDDDSSRFTIPPKIVVFFPTARLVQFYAEIFQEITKGVVVTNTDTTTDQTIKIPSWELHSKKAQGYRTRVSNEFREATVGVLFTSDVSARGVDYPNVSQVIQFGMPESREQYIHRLGRTGRAGSRGTGWLILQDWEASFLGELRGVDIPPNEELSSRILGNDESSGSDNDDAETLLNEVRRRVRGGDKVLSKSGGAAYCAFLGYYKSQMKRMKMKQSETLVNIANEFASSLGFQEPPQLSKQLVGKMGLKNVAGLNIGGDSFGGGGGRGGGNQGSGGNRSKSGRNGSNGNNRRFR